MRRALATGAVAALLAAVPLAVRAGPASGITLLTPSSGDVKAGVLSVTWSYKGFSRSAFVDVQAARADGAFAPIARVPIDDGTPGYVGSYNWATGPADDGADYTIRVVVPSNKRVSSSVSPVVIDNTGPEATEMGRSPAANDAGWNNSDVTVTWACVDTTSGAIESEVSSTVTGEGTDLSGSAVCVDRAGNETTAVAEGIDIDRTGSTATFHNRPFREGLPAFGILGGIPGDATDNLSGVAGVDVTFVHESGTETRRAADAAAWGETYVIWNVAVHGLAGKYTVTAVPRDVAGNAGQPISGEFVIVGMPTLEVPPVTVPDPTPSGVTPPDGTVVDETLSTLTVPPLPAVGLPV